MDRPSIKCIRVEYPDVPNFPDKENRVKIPAAWLIEKAGWKGKRKGNVGTWPSQPLVIVNYGGATGQEILDFSEQIREDMDTKFGVYLEREVNVSKQVSILPVNLSVYSVLFDMLWHFSGAGKESRANAWYPLKSALAQK